MISPKMRIWIENNFGKIFKNSKSAVYMNRIQTKIDKELSGLEWLCKNYPEIFLDEETEMDELTGKIVSNRRLKTLMGCINLLNPNCNVGLVLKRMQEEQEERKDYERKKTEYEQMQKSKKQ